LHSKNDYHKRSENFNDFGHFATIFGFFATIFALFLITLALVGQLLVVAILFFRL